MLHVKKILALVLPLAACSSPRDVPLEADAAPPRRVATAGMGGIVAGCLSAMIAGGCGEDSGTTETLPDGGAQTMMKDATGKDGHMNETTTINDGGTTLAADTGAPASDALPADIQPEKKIDVMDVIRRLTVVPAGVPFYFFFPAASNGSNPQSATYMGASLENAPMPNAMRCQASPRSLFTWDANGLSRKWWSSFNNAVEFVIVRPMLRAEMDKALMQPITDPTATTPEGKPVMNVPVKGIDEWIEANKADIDSAIAAVNSSPGEAFHCQ